MNRKIYDAAMESLKQTAKFDTPQREAIAKAIDAALEKFQADLLEQVNQSLAKLQQETRKRSA